MKYLKTVLQLSYDNATVTIDLLRMSKVQILRRAQGFSRVAYDSLANRKNVRDKLAYDIPKRNLSTS